MSTLCNFLLTIDQPLRIHALIIVMETMAKLVDYVSHMESKPLRVDVSGKAKK